MPKNKSTQVECRTIQGGWKQCIVSVGKQNNVPSEKYGFLFTVNKSVTSDVTWWSSASHCILRHYNKKNKSLMPTTSNNNVQLWWTDTLSVSWDNHDDVSYHMKTTTATNKHQIRRRKIALSASTGNTLRIHNGA